MPELMLEAAVPSHASMRTKRIVSSLTMDETTEETPDSDPATLDLEIRREAKATEAILVRRRLNEGYGDLMNWK